MSVPTIAQKGPYPVPVEAGKSYYWCSCGLSKNQPFCDGSHAGTGLSPIKFEAAETKTVFPPAEVFDKKARTPLRSMTIVDLKFHNGEVFVAGVSNQEFASTLRRIPYPFTGAASETQLEIYHLAHSKCETRAPIRTMQFATCTPPINSSAHWRTHRSSPSLASSIGSSRNAGETHHSRQWLRPHERPLQNPNSFPVLYCADSQMTALLEVQALFATADGQLHEAPRNPDLVLSLRCELARVLDLTVDTFYRDLGTTREELIDFTPSRFPQPQATSATRPIPFADDFEQASATCASEAISGEAW